MNDPAIDPLSANEGELAPVRGQEKAEPQSGIGELSAEAAPGVDAPAGYEQPGAAHSSESAELSGAPRLSRREFGVVLAGAAVGLIGATALPKRSAQASVLSGQARPAAAEVTDAEKPAAGGATYRLFGNHSGPVTAAATGSDGLVTSLLFEMTTGGGWLEGYWLWVCDKGQPTAPQKFTLWIPYQGAHYANTGEIIPETTVTSAKLVPGQWNFVPLPHAVPLSIATWYRLETGAVGGVPVSQNMWGPRDPWAKGITSGPLFAPSSGPNSTDQCATAPGSDPTKVVASYSQGSPYFWLDVQITTKAPAGSSFRLWPSMPLIVAPPKTTDSDQADTSEQSTGTEFWLSAECKLHKIWFFSPIPNPVAGTPAAALLPGACAIFDIANQNMVDGTIRGTPGADPTTIPDWRRPDGKAAKPGDGWVYCAYEGIRLPAGKYKTAVYCYGGGTTKDYRYYFFQEQRFYFGSVIDDNTGVVTGPATAPTGIRNGPMYSPSVARAATALSNGTVSVIPAGAAVRGNSTYQLNDASNTGTFLYPDTFDSADDGEVRWVDAEVTPL
jgi:hypothetical protein